MQSLRHAPDAPGAVVTPSAVATSSAAVAPRAVAAPRPTQRRLGGLFHIDPEFRRLAVRNPDAWWVVLVIDPIALPVLALLARMPRVTPLRITAVGSLIGAGSIAAFFSGHLVLGAVLFELRYFLDCLDGKLARVRGQVSDRGAFADVSADVVLIGATMVALGWRMAFRGIAGDHIPIALSGSCTFACLVLFWLILYDLDHATGAGTGAARRSPVGAWLHARRMYRLPRTIEVETLLLFIAPLTGNITMIVVCFALALTYYVLACVRLFVRLWGRMPGPPVGPSAG